MRRDTVAGSPGAQGPQSPGFPCNLSSEPATRREKHGYVEPYRALGHISLTPTHRTDIGHSIVVTDAGPMFCSVGRLLHVGVSTFDHVLSSRCAEHSLTYTISPAALELLQVHA